MSTEDQKRLQQSLPSPSPSPYRRRNRYKSLVDLARTTFSQPRIYFIPLLILSFALGYLSHSTKSAPLKSANEISAAACPKSTAGDDDVVDLTDHRTFSSKCSPPVPYSDVRHTILTKVFDGKSPFKNFPPPSAAPLLQKQWTKGWGSNATVFETMIREVRPRTIVEVGTFLGASAMHMAGLTRKLGLDSLIICIDDFRGWPGYYVDGGKSMKMVNGDSMLLYQFMQNVVTANATDSILFLPFSTTTAMEGLCDWGVAADLVEVDAAHDFHSAWVDINKAYKVLRKGGAMFGHDYVWPGVRAAVHQFARLNGFQVKQDGEHWVLY